jgi:hypothetical protein
MHNSFRLIFPQPSGASTIKKTVPHGPAGMKTTVVEVPDEQAGGTQKKKKKKKPKKKKKKSAATATAEGEDEDDDDEDAKEAEDEQMEKALADLSLDAKAAAAQAAPKTPPKQKAKPAAPQSSSIYGMGGASLPSSVSLVSTTAQSARSYLKAENLLEEKVKVKSRPESGAVVPPSPQKGGKDKDKDGKKVDKSKPKENVFSRLLSGAKNSTQTCLHKMFGSQKGQMKWDDFVKVRPLRL